MLWACRGNPGFPQVHKGRGQTSRRTIYVQLQHSPGSDPSSKANGNISVNFRRLWIKHVVDSRSSSKVCHVPHKTVSIHTPGMFCLCPIALVFALPQWCTSPSEGGERGRSPMHCSSHRTEALLCTWWVNTMCFDLCSSAAWKSSVLQCSFLKVILGKPRILQVKNIWRSKGLQATRITEISEMYNLSQGSVTFFYMSWARTTQFWSNTNKVGLGHISSRSAFLIPMLGPSSW